MTRQQRLSQILDLLTAQGQVEIEEITDRFQVSPITARRDLNLLATEQLITRTHGGATVMGSAYELPLQYRIAQSMEGKLAISHAAARLVLPGQVVGLTGGTTTTEVARALGRREHVTSTSEEGTFTIVTNALNIGFEMAIRPHIRIVMTGGVARAQSFELIGPLAVGSLSEVALDWAFIGADALNASFGAATINEGESEVNRVMARAASKVVVVADSTKFGKTALSRIIGLDEIDVLITDTAPSSRFVSAAADHQVELVIANASALPEAR